jgi:hypothetical protein
MTITASITSAVSLDFDRLRTDPGPTRDGADRMEAAGAESRRPRFSANWQAQNIMISSRWQRLYDVE